MLKSSDLFHISYYNKTHYTGSINGMHYYIEKAADDQQDEVFLVWIFPGPFCFAKTADDLKESKTFPFTEESIPVIADWLNAQYEQRAGFWQQHKTLFNDSVTRPPGP